MINHDFLQSKVMFLFNQNNTNNSLLKAHLSCSVPETGNFFHYFDCKSD